MKWVWVQGYKGFNKHLSCKKFQYKVGETYSHKGKIKTGWFGKGFHFCLRLNDTYRFYPRIFSNRYCKVRGLVKVSDLNNYKGEIAARKIEILEELK